MFTYMLMFGMLFLAVLFILFSPVIYNLLVGPKFHGSLYLVKYITAGFMFQGFYFLISGYNFYAKKTASIASITIVCSILKIIFSIVLVSHFGIVGSAYSMVLVWLIFWLASWLLANKHIPMPWFG